MRRLEFQDRRIGQHLDGGFGNPGIARRYRQRIVTPLDQLDSEREAFFANPFAHPVQQDLIVVTRLDAGKLFGQRIDRRRQI